MSKKSKESWLGAGPSAMSSEPEAAPPPEPQQEDPLAAEPPPPKDPGAIEVGQVYDKVVVPNRPINKLGLRPGAVLPPLVIQASYGDGRWMAGFLGELATKIEVDTEMLKSGKLRR
jgi:hypothetical protein